MIKIPKLGLGSGSTLEARARLGLEKCGLVPPLRSIRFGAAENIEFNTTFSPFINVRTSFSRTLYYIMVFGLFSYISKNDT